MNTIRNRYDAPPGQKLGDMVVLVLKGLLLSGALTLLFFVVASLAWRRATAAEQSMLDGPNWVLSTAYLTALVPTMAAVAILACRSLRWRVVMEDRHLALGWACGLARKVSYADVTFLRLGTVGEQVRVAGMRPRVVPVSIEHGSGSRFRIWLREADAAQLFAGLRDRCARAAAIDRDGRTYRPPSDPGGAGRRRLAREMLIWGGGALGVGTLILGAALFASGAELGPENALAHARTEVYRILGAIQGIALIAFGLRTLNPGPPSTGPAASGPAGRTPDG